MAAMRTGAAETDAYLAEWRKADPVPVGDDLEAEADKAADELDASITTGSGWSLSPSQAARKMSDTQPISTRPRAGNVHAACRRPLPAA